VVINVIDILRITLHKAEDDTPIRANRHCPKSLQAAPERMQAKTRKVHVIRSAGGIETRQDVSELSDLLRRQPTRIVVFMKAAQPFVPDRPDHPVP
jgi:hypothetical protein